MVKRESRKSGGKAWRALGCGALTAWFAVVLIAAEQVGADDTPATNATSLPALHRVQPTEPPDVDKTFRIRGGFHLDLLAAEPLVTDPVAMEYDENGRAYVVEMVDYPYTDKSQDKPFTESTTDKPIGRIRLLEDVDGDGRFDRAAIFAEELSWPTGVAIWKGGIFVSATPDVWYLKDTDGDRRADVRRKVFTGFRKFNVQAVMNNLRWGLDHKIYAAGASNGGEIRTVAQLQAMAQPLRQNDFCFDPRNDNLQLLSGGARFGNSFDDWGNRFICNIRNPLEHVVLPRHYLARNPLLPVTAAVHDAALAGDTLPVFRVSPPEPWRAVRADRWANESGQKYPKSELAAEGYFTSASGVTIYRGAAYPPEYRGNAFVGEVSGNLIHRQKISPDGVTFVAHRADEGTEFVASTDNWFRPVNFVNAPDGTLHVLDMYRETIEHPWSIPDDLKAQLDLESGRDRGRIYRLAPPGFQAPAPPKLGEADTATLVATLENPNGWWRDTAHRLIFERQDETAIEPLAKLLRDSPIDVARLHALWSLAGLSKLGDEDLLVSLGDSSAGVREHAVQLAESRLTVPKVFERLLQLADDDESRVRFQVAFSLGEVRGEQAARALARIARRDAADPWIRTAVLSSTGGQATPFLQSLVADGSFCASSQAELLLRTAAQVVGSQNRPVEIAKVLDALAALPPAAGDGQWACVVGLGQGLKRSDKNLHDVATAGGATRPAVKLIEDLMIHADRTARDASTDDDQRLRAIELIACGEFGGVREALAALVDPRQAQPIQLAAIRALATFRSPEVAPTLLAPYRSLTPAARTEIVQTLLTRPEWTRPLVDALDARTVSVADVPAVRRAILLKHSDETIRRKAAELFATDVPGVRGDVVSSYAEALKLPGDAGRGVTVAQRECLSCHKLGDGGHDVGPNLLSVRHRTPDELLLHILDPNREVAPNFVEYVVTQTDGRSTTGIVVAETATSITLRRAEGRQETILRDDIDEMASSGRSLMPEGLEQRVSREEMADLVALLLSRKPQ